MDRVEATHREQDIEPELPGGTESPGARASTGRLESVSWRSGARGERTWAVQPTRRKAPRGGRMMARRISQARDAAPAMMVTEGEDGVEWWSGGGEAACARGGAGAGSGSGAVAFRHKAAVARREAQRRAGRSAARGGRLAAHVRARERRGTGAVPSAPGGCACVRVDACMPPGPRSGRPPAVTPVITAHEPGTGAVPAGLLDDLQGRMHALLPTWSTPPPRSPAQTSPHHTAPEHTTPHHTRRPWIPVARQAGLTLRPPPRCQISSHPPGTVVQVRTLCPTKPIIS